MLLGTERFTAVWSSAYRNCSVSNQSDIMRTLVVARRGALDALQSSITGRDSTAALGLGSIRLEARLKALALECVMLDPLERPSIAAVISATWPFCPSPSPVDSATMPPPVDSATIHDAWATPSTNTNNPDGGLPALATATAPLPLPFGDALRRRRQARRALARSRAIAPILGALAPSVPVAVPVAVPVFVGRCARPLRAPARVNAPLMDIASLSIADTSSQAAPPNTGAVLN
jgi:hypothetical protein